MTEDKEEYPCLEVLAGPIPGGRLSLRKGKNLIGRLSENDIVLDDSSISRRHALIEVGEGGATIADQGSRNGTKIQGQRLEPDQPYPLTHNTRLQLGAFQLRYLTQAAPPATAEPVREPEPAQPELSQEPPLETNATGEEPPSEEMPEAPRVGRRWGRLLLFGLMAVLLVAAVYEVFQFMKPGKKTEKARTIEEEETEGEEGEAISGGDERQLVPSSSFRQVILDFTSEPIPAAVFFGKEEIGQTDFRVSSPMEDGKLYEARAIYKLEEIGETLEEIVTFAPTAGVEVLPVRFRAKVGLFKILSLPAGVDVYLEGSFDSDPTRTKPIKFGEITFGKPIYIPYGQYSVELRRSRPLEGAQDFIPQVVYRRKFEIKEGGGEYALNLKEADLSLFPLQIASIPSGAKVLVDGQELGTTPYEGQAATGEHILVLRREGFFDYSQPIRMDLNAPFVSEIPLKTSLAGEIINKATTMISEKRHGEALPLLVEGLSRDPTPRETAEISYLIGICYLWQRSFQEADGYFRKTMEHQDLRLHGRLGLAHIAFHQGDPVKSLQLLIEILVSSQDLKLRNDAGILFQQISPLKSVIYVNSSPAGAIVFVNSEQVSQMTPLILRDLGVGTYRIEIKKVGFVPQEIKLNLGVAEFRPVVVTLQPVGET